MLCGNRAQTKPVANSCTAINPATLAGAIPAKLCVSARAMVTAGLAKDVEDVHQ